MRPNPPNKNEKSIEQIAQKGDDLATLKELRQKLARTIDKSESGRDIASLSRQLQIVMQEIAELEAQEQNDEILEIIQECKMKPIRRNARGHAPLYGNGSESTEDDL